MENNFTNTKTAIQRFDRYHRRWKREFERLIENLPNAKGIKRTYDQNGRAVMRAFKNCERYRLRVVAAAFYADTKEYNRLDNCRLLVLDSHSIGQTDICEFIRRVAA